MGKQKPKTILRKSPTIEIVCEKITHDNIRERIERLLEFFDECNDKVEMLWFDYANGDYGLALKNRQICDSATGVGLVDCEIGEQLKAFKNVEPFMSKCFERADVLLKEYGL